MALPNFIDKAALSVSKLIKDFDRGNFEEILLTSGVEIYFDETALTTEGQLTLDMLVRLLGRLYPNIKITGNEKSCQEKVESLSKLVLQINPEVTTSSFKTTVRVVVGTCELKDDVPTFYLGSENWVVKFSTHRAVGSADNNNPFGAGAAACFGAANVFRTVFKENLPYGKIDSDFELSLFNFSTAISDPGPLIAAPQLSEITAVGMGAIGNSFIWALRNIQGIAGEINVVDGEAIDLTNLQRYVLAIQDSVTIQKVKLVEELLKESMLKVNPYPVSWQEFIASRENYKLETVVMAVDSAKDRIAIQGSLPNHIFNAWTQLEALGVSRHINFLDKPCVACLYTPSGEGRSYSQEIADNLGLIGEEYERLVRGHLAMHRPVDENLISLVATAKGIDVTELTAYIGEPLETFHAKVICGGIMMKLTGKSGEEINVEVPCAFESALAGIVLAADMIVDSLKLREEVPTITRFNLMRPLNQYLNENINKLASGRCICQDEVFRDVYREKFSLRDKT